LSNAPAPPSSSSGQASRRTSLWECSRRSPTWSWSASRARARATRASVSRRSPRHHGHS
jgi:hypothetical protein